MIDSRELLEKEIKALADRIEATDENLLPNFDKARDCGLPHIELDDQHYHYISMERGEETEHVTTASKDDLLYRIFRDITFSMACRYEAAHRAPGRDFSRVLFAHQLELLSRLSSSWAERREREIAAGLKLNPYCDN